MASGQLVVPGDLVVELGEVRLVGVVLQEGGVGLDQACEGGRGDTDRLMVRFDCGGGGGIQRYFCSCRHLWMWGLRRSLFVW